MVLDNDNGTAPGLILEENGKRMILLPGPPNELHPLFEQQVKPYLQKLSPEIFYSRTVKLEEGYSVYDKGVENAT